MNPTLHEGKLEHYMDAIQAISASTDDYLYVLDLQTDQNWFFGDISRNYDVLNDKGYVTTDEWEKIIHPKDRKALRADMEEIFAGKKFIHDMKYRLVNRRGKPIWISCRGRVLTDENGTPTFMVGRVSDTVLLHRVDDLTGLFNFAQMMEDAERLIKNQKFGYVILFGIDNLRNINIRHGRETGDKSILLLAEALKGATDSNYIYRLDGDIFAVYLTDATQQEVENYYEEVRGKLWTYFTVSAGAVGIRRSMSLEPSSIYQYVEYALDKAKKHGKNELVFFTDEDYQNKIDTIGLVEELEDSVENDFEGFRLVFQPQIKKGSYHLFGAEALLRYDSKERGQIFPDVFIPLLEQNGMMYSVGLWVLEKALEQCRIWREYKPSFHISVNISYVQINEPRCKTDVLQVLRRSGVPGEALTLEITESMQLEKFDYYNEIFKAWRKEGIEISVDDFGTGYSNLGYLKNLNIDEIKIDRSFISGIQNNSYNYRLLSNMVELAAGVQARICCEGVEENDELQVLEGLKPDLLQGYFFSRPCATDEFESIYFDEASKRYQEYKQRIKTIRRSNITDYLELDHSGILQGVQIGVWHLRLSPNGEHDKMYIDETLYRLMGLNRKLTPEEALHYWFNHVKPECQGHICEALQHVMDSGEVSSYSYVWIHPELGEVDFSGRAMRIIDSDGRVSIQGTQMMLGRNNKFVYTAPQNKIENLKSFDEQINEVLRRSLQETDPDVSAQIILGFVGSTLGAERAYVFEKQKNGNDENTYVWGTGGITEENGKLVNVAPEICVDWYHAFRRKAHVIINDIESIRETEPQKYELLVRLGVQSLAVVPLYDGKEVIGFYGIDNPRDIAPDEVINMLRTMSYFMSAIIKRRNMLEDLNYMSYCDQLTKFGNRFAMEEYLHHLDLRESLGVWYCDIVGLKRVNDEQGHEAGDELIKRSCDCLRAIFREKHLFRIGGDELLVLYKGITKERMEELDAALRQLLEDRQVALSLGYAWGDAGMKDARALMSEAEKRMYRDKAEYYKRSGLDRRVE